MKKTGRLKMDNKDYYKVSEYEKLYDIAKMEETTVGKIIADNPYLDVYNLKSGDELYISGQKNKS